MGWRLKGEREGKGCSEGKLKEGGGDLWKGERSCGQVGKPVKMRKNWKQLEREKGNEKEGLTPSAIRPTHCRQIHLLKPSLR